MPNRNLLKVFFATAADVEALGAPRSIDVPMVKALNDLGYKVSWFGINIDSRQDFAGEMTSLNYSRLQRFFIRVKNKLLRDLKIQTGEDQKLIAQKKFDIWMSRILESRRGDIDKNLVFIGRSVSSELSFQTIRKYGGRCVLHSQWMHPVTHSRILEGAFSDLDSSYKPVPRERLATQLREIDLCDQVWCISRLVLDSYLKNGVSKEKLFLCPLGVDTNYFKPGELTFKEDVDKFIIVFVGNINIEKGIHILLEASTLNN